MARRPKWMFPFLRQLVLTGDPRLAAEAVGMAYADIGRRRLRDREFARFWDSALNMRVHWLELRQRYPDIGGEPAPPPSPLMRAPSPSPSLRDSEEHQ